MSLWSIERKGSSLTGIKNARTSLDLATKLEPTAPESQKYLARMDALEKKPPESARSRREPAQTVDALIARNPRDVQGWTYLIKMDQYHGKADELLEIVFKAADTNLFDTQVPALFLKVISELGVGDPFLYTREEVNRRIHGGILMSHIKLNTGGGRSVQARPPLEIRCTIGQARARG